MRFTNSPYEGFMKEKATLRVCRPACRRRAPAVTAALTGAGSAACSATGSNSNHRATGGDAVGRELTRTEKRQSAGWYQNGVPTMTGTAAACRWIASAICLGNAGRGLIAATSARQFCPLIRRWRLRCWQKDQGRISRLARYAAEPWLLMDGKPIVRRPVQRRHTADSSGNICEKAGLMC